MKTVLLVNISSAYISNDTCQPVELTDNQKLISSVFTNEFTFVQLYTPMAKFSGKTYKDLEKQIYEYSLTNSHDFLSIIIKK